MQRIGAILGGLLLFGVIAAVFVTTQIQFGDDGTLADRVPVLGEVARIADQGQPPLFFVPEPDQDALGRLDCGEFWALERADRIARAGPLADAMNGEGADVDDSQAADILDGACQTQADDVRVARATAELFERAQRGADIPSETCSQWSEDLRAIAALADAPRRENEALFSSLDEGQGLEGFYGALVTAERSSRIASRRLEELGVTTHAGRKMADWASDSQRNLAAAHAVFLGGVEDFDAWSGPPSGVSNYNRWDQRMRAIETQVANAAVDGDLTPALVDPACAPQALGL